MKKVILAVALAAFSGTLFAETLTASGSVTTSCSFSNTAAGTLAISDTSVTTSSAPTTDVLNNDPAVYDVTVGNQSLSAPVGVSVLAVDIQNPSQPAGAVAIFTAGVEADGASDNLAAAGTYSMAADFTATLASTATAGNYVATVNLTCAPAGGGEF